VKWIQLALESVPREVWQCVAQTHCQTPRVTDSKAKWGPCSDLYWPRYGHGVCLHYRYVVYDHVSALAQCLFDQGVDKTWHHGVSRGGRGVLRGQAKQCLQNVVLDGLNFLGLTVC
jgi:hypothetical protein